MAGSKKSEGGLVWGVRASLWRGMWGVEEGVPGRDKQWYEECPGCNYECCEVSRGISRLSGPEHKMGRDGLRTVCRVRSY